MSGAGGQVDRLGSAVGGSWRSGRNMTMKLGAASISSLSVKTNNKQGLGTSDIHY